MTRSQAASTPLVTMALQRALSPPESNAQHVSSAAQPPPPASPPSPALASPPSPGGRPPPSGVTGPLPPQKTPSAATQDWGVLEVANVLHASANAPVSVVQHA